MPFVDGALSFNDFFRSEYPKLLRILGASDPSAQDALQDAFVKAAHAWAKISLYDEPAAWVRKVAVRRMMNERRWRRRRGVLVETLGALDHQSVSDHDLHLDLSAAIETLPLQQRLALALFYLGDFSSAQTAELMGISDGAVRFHLSKGRAALREQLGDTRYA